MRIHFSLALSFVSLAWLVAPRGAYAQRPDEHAGMAGMSMPDSAGPSRWHVMAQAIPVLTHAAHTAGGADLTEGYLAQSVLMTRGSLWRGHAQLDATLNGEGLTMTRGELSTGGFGEGYVDRRHPHAYLHELVLTGVGSFGPFNYSASAGRGFAPFGTDDPMMRPFEKYPLNHHLAQILERGLIAGAMRVGPAIVEGATFGGDEPTSPSAMPRLRRFGDSWSMRATLLPRPGTELQASYARIESPEQASGFGLDQRKRSASVRMISRDGSRYALAEWASTAEWDGDRNVEAFAYESALAEAAATVGPIGVAVRLEQTGRPEEERLADPFRTPRPASDLAITGITRWRVGTLALTLPSVTHGAVRGYPFVELARLSARSTVATSVFSPERFYGGGSPWMGSIGFRVRYGPLHARMGRYGVALADSPAIRALGVSADAPHAHQH
ncbi:MAG TPA: hypothetical protein VGP25_04325 [Gemmatimonadaceae bacterium]|nr:hypothetical protein [Gemmatimonadaceae bacterium]